MRWGPVMVIRFGLVWALLGTRQVQAWGDVGHVSPSSSAS